MARKKRKRRGRSLAGWIRSISYLIASATALFYYAYQYFGLAPGDKARIFAAYADLGLKPTTLQRMQASPDPPVAKPAHAPWRRISRIIDGDTLEVDDGVKVRLLGIDTPESSENNHLFRDLGRMGNIADKHQMIAMGKEATRYARSLAQGKRCWLEYETNRTDDYGRELAYVHLEDGTNLNEAMVSHGYAKVYMSQPFKYKKRYVLLQLAAMRERRGFWAGEEEATRLESDAARTGQEIQVAGAPTGVLP
ncbi:MAG: thermonuclease family protein [Planctomycetes bacterium]|nr:thermonuclease family protein [Planctomycetota bacterium]